MEPEKIENEPKQKSRKKAKKKFSVKANRQSVLLVIGGLVFGLLIGLVITSPAITGAAVSEGDVRSNMASLFPQIDIVEINDLGSLYEVVYEVASPMGPQKSSFHVSKDGTHLITGQLVNLKEYAALLEEQNKEAEGGDAETIGNFLVSSDDVCTEDSKPIIYFFGGDGCPHCKWEHPLIEGVAAKFEGYIAFHDNMNSDADREILSKYSTGGVPTTVLGCKYYKVGSGERLGEEEEAKVLTALICKLTGNQPADVCANVQTLIDEAA